MPGTAFGARPAKESATILVDFEKAPPMLANGFSSTGSHTIWTVCWVNNIDGRSSAVYQGTKALPYIAYLLTQNAKYMATASAYSFAVTESNRTLECCA